jgi:hypothetical protein
MQTMRNRDICCDIYFNILHQYCFYLFLLRFCQACPIQCTACTSATSCQNCTAEYYLSGSECLLPFEPLVGSVNNSQAKSIFILRSKISYSFLGGMIILGFIIGGTTTISIAAYLIHKYKQRK